jgi:hypothetical protein
MTGIISSLIVLSRKKPIKIMNITIYSSLALRLFVGLWSLLQFRNLFYTDGRTPLTSLVARSLSTHRTTQTQNKRTYKLPCLEWD